MKLSAVVAAVIFVLAAAFMAMPTPAAPASAALDANSFQVDSVHSSIVFKIRHLGVSNFYGRFNDFGGTFTFDPDDLDAANFDIAVKATSIDTGNDRRDGHLRSADFFTTDEYETITFKSTGVKKAAKEGMYELTGDLTLLGETKPITASLEWFGTIEHERMGSVGGFEAIFTVKRSDFGMDYGVSQGALGDEVTLFVGMEGRQPRQATAENAEQ